MSEKILNDLFFLKNVESQLAHIALDKEENYLVNNLDIDKSTDAIFDIYTTIFSDLKSIHRICNSKKDEFSKKKFKFNIDRLETLNNYIRDQLTKYISNDIETMSLDENTYKMRFSYPYGENGIDNSQFHSNMDSLIKKGAQLTEYGRNAAKKRSKSNLVNFEYSIIFLELDLYNVFDVYFR